MSSLARFTGLVFQLRLNMLLEYAAAKTDTRGGEVFRWQVLRDACISAKRSTLPVEECQKLDETYGSRSKSTRGFAWLFSAISTIRIAQCSDPHDKVYTALSFANYLMDRHIRNFIVPNYFASVADVFMEDQNHHREFRIHQFSTIRGD
jgi:hypothetical protein